MDYLFSKSANIWSMMQNNKSKNGDFKKNGDIKKPEIDILWLFMQFVITFFKPIFENKC